MKLYKRNDQAYLIKEGRCYQWTVEEWDVLVNREQLYQYLSELTGTLQEIPPLDWEQEPWDPPMDGQEVWAAGVTYYKSKQARMEESQGSGGDRFYDLVYDAPRPELFFKSNRQRTVGHLDQVNIRKDSRWNVPEPELTLLINTHGKIQGYTAGNDMSSRSIEGENPLYLPQAKVYERCAALGPCLYIPEVPIDPQAEIRLEIERKGQALYKDHVKISRMKRTHRELVDYLFTECQFPQGVFLMTGTCLVPGDDFTLEVDDQVSITIDHVGRLTNRVGTSS